MRHRRPRISSHWISVPETKKRAPSSEARFPAGRGLPHQAYQSADAEAVVPLLFRLVEKLLSLFSQLLRLLAQFFGLVAEVLFFLPPVGGAFAGGLGCGFPLRLFLGRRGMVGPGLIAAGFG